MLTRGARVGTRGQSCAVEGKGREGKGKEGKGRELSCEHAKLSASENDQKDKKPRSKKPQSWKDFYRLYPEHRRGGSDSTPWKKFKTMKLSDDDLELMLADVKKRYPNGQGEYAYGITKYLSEKIWLTPLPYEANQPQHVRPQKTLSEIVREQSGK